MLRPVLAFATAASLLGCTHWETSQTLGQQREVRRRLVGAPQIEEVTTRVLSGGAGASASASGRTGAAVIGGAQETVKRTHCVQQAEIEYAQDIALEAHVAGRKKDVITSLLIGGGGLLLGALAYTTYHRELDNCTGGPNGCAEVPREPTVAYALGGAAVALAGGWLVYSFAALPKGTKPTPPPMQKTWTETVYVEATGCGLVPGDAPAPAVPPTPAPATP